MGNLIKTKAQHISIICKRICMDMGRACKEFDVISRCFEFNLFCYNNNSINKIMLLSLKLDRTSVFIILYFNIVDNITLVHM